MFKNKPRSRISLWATKVTVNYLLITYLDCYTRPCFRSSQRRWKKTLYTLKNTATHSVNEICRINPHSTLLPQLKFGELFTYWALWNIHMDLLWWLNYRRLIKVKGQSLWQWNLKRKMRSWVFPSDKIFKWKEIDFKKDGKPFPQNSEIVVLLYEKETPQSCDCSLGRKGRAFPSWMDASWEAGERGCTASSFHSSQSFPKSNQTLNWFSCFISASTREHRHPHFRQVVPIVPVFRSLLFYLFPRNVISDRIVKLDK